MPIQSLAFWLDTFEHSNYLYVENAAAMDETQQPQRDMLLSHGVASQVAVPLRRDGAVIGFLGVDDPGKNQAHQSNLSALGDYIAVILTRRDLEARIEG